MQKMFWKSWAKIWRHSMGTWQNRGINSKRKIGEALLLRDWRSGGLPFNSDRSIWSISNLREVSKSIPPLLKFEPSLPNLMRSVTSFTWIVYRARLLWTWIFSKCWEHLGRALQRGTKGWCWLRMLFGLAETIYIYIGKILHIPLSKVHISQKCRFKRKT